MSKAIEHVHWPDAPDLWMPYAPRRLATDPRCIVEINAIAKTE